MEIKREHFSTETWRELLKAAPPQLVHEQFCQNTADGFAECTREMWEDAGGSGTDTDILAHWYDCSIDQMSSAEDRITDILTERANEPKELD